MKKVFTTLLFLSIHIQASAQNASEIKLKLEKLKSVGAVLYIADHPDDENTRLLAYLANELKVRTAYLSLTRGDGGQNLIGTEQSEKLGMIRTQELLAARSIDGAEQYFSRAFDFGFSKNPEETFTFWNKDSIIADMVWVIRNFQPDIIITRFPTDGSGGHGHHTASAILAEIAMDYAADETKFPEQLKQVSVWKVKRLVWNGFNFGGRPQSDGKDFTKIDIGSYSALLGKSYGEIASQSRSQHKSQGFGVPMQRGASVETFKYIKGDSVKNSIFDGIDFTWLHLKNGKMMQVLIEKLNKSFDPIHPEKSIPQLIKIDNALNAIENTYWVNQKRKEISDLVFACAGLFIDITSAEFSTTPGSKIKINIQSINRSNANVKLNRISVANSYDTTINLQLANNSLFNYSTKIIIDKNQAYTNPYWLLEHPSKGLFHVANQQNIGRAYNTPSMPTTFYFTIEGKEYQYTRDVKYKWVDPVKGELYRNLEVLPTVQLSFNAKNLIFTSKDTKKKVQVILRTNESDLNGTVKLKMPIGWTCTPQEILFNEKSKGTTSTFEFEISAQANAESGKIIPIATVGNTNYSLTVEHIQYDHIPVQTQVKNASLNIEKIDMQVIGTRVGYIPGAGDEIPEALKNMGFEVVMLTDDILNSQDLSSYDVIIAGIRLYNTNDKMQSYYDKLMNYVSNGGNFVVQYNTNNFISSVSSKIGPYPFQIGRDRVTDENAKMNIINTNDLILNYPNKITENDFSNWVQERGLYFVTNVDEHYSKTFSTNDPNEKSGDGILVSCKYGKGVFTYTGISFFRQLPAGVPGAYRLFANIISQGK
jgi:LmbE family N-acetylglucosaminyl deacetylase